MARMARQLLLIIAAAALRSAACDLLSDWIASTPMAAAAGKSPALEAGLTAAPMSLNYDTGIPLYAVSWSSNAATTTTMEPSTVSTRS